MYNNSQTLYNIILVTYLCGHTRSLWNA